MSDKAKQVLSYIFPIVGIIFMLMKENTREVKLVGAQATTLWIFYFAITFLYRLIPIYIPMFSTIVYAAYMVFGIMGIVKVYKGQDLELPLIGDLAKKIFSKVIEG